MDTICQEHRSWVMSRIRATDTKPEKYVRSLLWSNGFRYRLHVKKLPGRPDIVLTRYKTVIDVRGCFWHCHKHCKLFRMPKSNVEFWEEKFCRNVARDQRSEAELRAAGWKVIVLWECELKHTHKLVLEPLLEMRKQQQQAAINK